MAISSSSLIHFTGTKEALLGILEENFRVYNCKESICFGTKPNEYRIPMVSFCDIPLSQVKEHIHKYGKYGKYGIGLTKDWGKRKRLNPVLYFAKSSFIANSYMRALQHFAVPEDTSPDLMSSEQKALLDVVRYIKNYEGTLKRKGKVDKNYRFSDEREWRYVPPVEEPCEMIVSESWYASPENKDAMDQKLDPIRLTFDPNDIKYVIIDNDNEINELVDHLKRVKGKNYTLYDIERLTTRILTSEQIMSDM
jgi:hypothetical protein